VSGRLIGGRSLSNAVTICSVFAILFASSIIVPKARLLDLDLAAR
tara:strand:- start:238 stop:372 length:135 start_codon:yes stop_codon:yes gene_type:complete